MSSNSQPTDLETTSTDPPYSHWLGLTDAALQALAARYEVLEEVGRGGMAVVYKARHTTLGRLVELKVTLPGLSRERFLREARLLAAIGSPHVVVVHDCDELPDGFPVLVMEWIEGSTLQRIFKERDGPMPEADVLPWMRQVSEGM